jgi:ATP-binding cassette subfamily B (MDR/TAP) protein 1
VAGIRTIQLLTRENDVEAKYLQILARPLKNGLKSAWLNTLLYAFSAIINFGVNAVIFLYGGSLLVNDGYTVNQLFTVFIAIVFGSLSAGLYLILILRTYLQYGSRFQSCEGCWKKYTQTSWLYTSD